MKKSRNESYLYEIEGKTRLGDNFIEKKAVFKQLFQNYPQAIVLLDEEERIVKVNYAFTEMFGYDTEEINGRWIDDLIVPDDYLNEAELFLEKALKGEDFREKTVRRDKNGNYFEVMITGCPVIIEGKSVGVYGIYESISDNLLPEKGSIYDHSTGLYRKNYFKNELKRCDCEKNYPLSIFVIDVNGLKFVNDVFGHHKGDRLLEKAANIIQNTIPDKGSLARWGGDEFTILLPRTNEEEAEEIKANLEENCLKYKIDKINISVAIGYAIKEKVEQNIYNIFNQAEEKMYDDKIIKNRKRDTIRFSFLNNIFKDKVQSELDQIQEISELSLDMGKALNLSQREMVKLKDLSIFYDVGKVRLPERIIEKHNTNKQLLGQELELYKKHTKIGYQIIRNSHMLSNIAEEILYHHERWDGTGYPHGLKRDEIPLLSRIIAITSDYSYENSKEGKEKLIQGKGSKYDPNFVDVFLNKVLS